MLSYLIRRAMLAILTVWAITVLSFIIIQAPPGDYLTAYISQLQASGSEVREDEALALRQQYGLDNPMFVQYFKWIGRMGQGNFGMAMAYGRPGQ